MDPYSQSGSGGSGYGYSQGSSGEYSSEISWDNPLEVGKVLEQYDVFHHRSEALLQALNPQSVLFAPFQELLNLQSAMDNLVIASGEGASFEQEYAYFAEAKGFLDNSLGDLSAIYPSCMDAHAELSVKFSQAGTPEDVRQIVSVNDPTREELVAGLTPMYVAYDQALESLAHVLLAWANFTGTLNTISISFASVVPNWDIQKGWESYEDFALVGDQGAAVINAEIVPSIAKKFDAALRVVDAALTVMKMVWSVVRNAIDFAEAVGLNVGAVNENLATAQQRLNPVTRRWQEVLPKIQQCKTTADSLQKSSRATVSAPHQEATVVAPEQAAAPVVAPDSFKVDLESNAVENYANMVQLLTALDDDGPVIAALGGTLSPLAELTSSVASLTDRFPPEGVKVVADVGDKKVTLASSDLDVLIYILTGIKNYLDGAHQNIAQSYPQYFGQSKEISRKLSAVSPSTVLEGSRNIFISMSHDLLKLMGVLEEVARQFRFVVGNLAGVWYSPIEEAQEGVQGKAGAKNAAISQRERQDYTAVLVVVRRAQESVKSLWDAGVSIRDIAKKFNVLDSELIANLAPFTQTADASPVARLWDQVAQAARHEMR